MSNPKVIIATSEAECALYVNGSLYRQWHNGDCDVVELLEVLNLDFETEAVEPRWISRVGYQFPQNETDVFWDFH